MSASWIGSGLPPIRRGAQDYFLLSHDGQLYLIANSCPHRGGPLKFGFVNAAGEIVCPMHGGAFAIRQLIARPSTIRLREDPAGAAD